MIRKESFYESPDCEITALVTALGILAASFGEDGAAGSYDSDDDTDFGLF